jgi:RNA polymerase sigma factor (TIGR02999 family)
MFRVAGALLRRYTSAGSRQLVVSRSTSVKAETTKKLAHDIGELASDIDKRGRAAVDRLFPVLYQELKGIARRQRRGERQHHSLNTTDLVHEAYVKLLGLDRMNWQGRAHFLAVAAQAMRRVLVDYAVATKAQKRGGQRRRVSLDDAMLRDERPVEQLIAVDAQLSRLEALNPRLAQIVECRFFSGMSIEETAEALNSSPATVKRDWNLARAWLHRELGGGRRPEAAVNETGQHGRRPLA